MKKSMLLMACMVLLTLSCSKPAEEAIDCATELVISTFTAEANPSNTKEVTFTFEYGGGFNIAIVWEFGDGTSSPGTGIQVTHTYAEPGYYDVKANVTLSGPDKSDCSASKSMYVNVQ